jgi:hypothetical protein
VILPSKIHGAFVAEGKALKHEYEHSPAKCSVFCPGQASQHLIATPEHRQALLVEMFRYYSFPPRFKIVKNFATSSNGLTVKKLLYQPE